MGYSACIVAAGGGERAGGGTPKQFRTLAGRAMLSWSVERFANDPACEQIIIAHAADQARDVETCLKGVQVDLVQGGESRTASVRNALALAHCDHVLIHDAARPLLTQGLIDRLRDALSSHDGAAPALAVSDALAREDEAGVTPVSRDALFRIQTPQAFRTEPLREAFANAQTDFPDEVSLARAQGLDVVLTQGEEANFKVTYPQDFERAEQLLALPASQTPSVAVVTGMGYDVHRMEAGDGVHLCGVFIECPYHLIGHSDADAGLHAITDALLGASGLGDIGDHFPPSDDQWKGADSAMFLKHAVKIARDAGVRPVHVDVTLICERPKIGPHKVNMKHRIAEIMDLDPRRVNIKATTTEKLGFTGRGEGLAAEAIVTGALS
ncbi:bifunctional 2-C-methyl-D-erythritol 4-phosphate cytidylyltransferase/2-C-methyl-D-erythritol 2,4-cyclodiphosphate synthase [Oceanicaulis sp. MMSF_3324]|uniref:bifunctional 2-C-methyl-D-erythritol 4-phosphate cytidylyltransferase/2-C-methyl-D-erythritol 2,4-cyclodiphosphate synthase n=1 Tax=Oceanicaulis sp. MMSF_3324 TaxID=3046702 RepID=UPI00273D3F8E|nr:bifunctional 2-C-methyl-D-erythritol 4-phosphate cytidylyltransferase/2-C-methyl-D-erythritol 2,4-cyclodiphosphate synthase [Oceanicaulis sp. MMSF_3324]